MGFFGNSGVSPAKYTMPVSMPSVSTDTKLRKYETPKEAETADLEDYWRVERRRKGENGVRGTFTMGRAEDE